MTAVFTPPRAAIIEKLNDLDLLANDTAPVTPFLIALVQHYGALELSMVDDTLPSPCNEFLIHLGKQMNQDLEHTKEILGKLPGFYGFIFGTEALVSQASHGQTGEPTVLGTTQRVRVFMAADLDGRVYQLSHFLGRADDVEILDELSAPRLLRHPLIVALLRCVRAMSVWLQDGGTTLARLDDRLQEAIDRD